MRYRVSQTGFLERFIAKKGKGEVWGAMICPFAATPEPIHHCGNWCPLFECYLPISLKNVRTGEPTVHDGEVTLWCGGEPRKILLREGTNDAGQIRDS